MKLLKQILYFSFYLLSIAHNSFSQSQILIGGAAYEDARSVLKTTDGYVLAGSTTSFGIGNYDMYIVKLDNNMNIQWSGTVGGTGADRSYCITQTIDNGFVFGGYTSFPPAADGDFYIAKYSNSGIFLWSRTLAGNVTRTIRSISKTSDGGCVAAGSTFSNINNQECYIVKLDAGGNMQWVKLIGGTLGDTAKSVIQTIDGGFIMAGSTSSFGVMGQDVYVIKTDNTGSVIWSATVGGPNNQEGNCIIQTLDSGYAISGVTESAIDNKDMYFIKLDKSGSFQWAKNIGGGLNDMAYSIIQNNDGSYVLAGETNSFGANGPDFYIVKFDVNGFLLWSRVTGGTTDDNGYSITKNINGYSIAGLTTSFSSGLGNMYLVNISENGLLCGNSVNAGSLVGSGAIFTSASSNISSPNWTLTTPPSSVGNGGGNISIICIITSVIQTGNEIPNDYKLLQNYPNPFNPVTNIKFSLPDISFTEISIFDINGAEVSKLIKEELRPGKYEIVWNASQLPSGVYFSVMKAGKYTESRKILLVK